MLQTIHCECLEIRNVGGLDPILLIFHDTEPGKGQLILKCYTSVWTAWWGGMSGQTVREFIQTCDTDYLLNALWCHDVKRTPQNTNYLRRILAAVLLTLKTEIPREQPVRPG